MTLVWTGNLLLPSSSQVQDIRLVSHSTFVKIDLPAKGLEFLAYVDVNNIPLHLAAAPSLTVGCGSEATQQWLLNACLAKTDDGANTPAWYGTGQGQSNIGILARVPGEEVMLVSSTKPRITEILFYVTRQPILQSMTGNLTSGNNNNTQSHPSRPSSGHLQLRNEHNNFDRITIHALPLSSDLLYSPALDLERITTTDCAELRTRMDTLFDEASDRRKRARRNCGQSVSLAAARGAVGMSAMQQSQQRRGTSVSVSPKVESGIETPEHDSFGNASPRASPMIFSEASMSRPASRQGGGAILHQQASFGITSSSTHQQKSLETMSAGPDAFEDTSFEARNKQAISRTVMAGMRMYGLQQRKAGQGQSQVQSQVQETDVAAEAARDSEYKGVYHQTYKGTMFAFRNRLTSELLGPEDVREAIDRLLALFCAEPS